MKLSARRPSLRERLPSRLGDLGPRAGVMPVKWNQVSLRRCRPIELSRAQLGDRRIRAVVDDDGCSLAGAGFQKIDADSIAAAQRFRDVSTPKPRRMLTALSPNGFFGRRVTNAASRPNCASETATLASPPPK